MAGRFANGGPLVEVAMNSAGAKAGGPPPTANGSGSGGAAGGDGTLARADRDGWSRGGRQFASSREVYTRSLFRICLKFTTSEDEDEGKPEPGTAYPWKSVTASSVPRLQVFGRGQVACAIRQPKLAPGCCCPIGKPKNP